MLVDKAHLPNSDQQLRPIHIFGVVVESGKRTVLNLKMHTGMDLEEIGKPAVAMEKFIVLSDELERLQAQIDELKKK
jgi:hypothetical protein